MKKLLCFFCAFSLMVFLPACSGNNVDAPSSGSSTVTEPPASASANTAISMEEYKGIVLDFNSRIMDESVLLANVGLYEYDFWKTYSGISQTVSSDSSVNYDSMVESAMEWLSENSDSDADAVTAAYNELIATYATIADATVDGELPAGTADLVDSLFGAYYQLYTTVTEPSGTIEDFIYTLNDCTNAITMFNSDLESALDT